MVEVVQKHYKEILSFFTQLLMAILLIIGFTSSLKYNTLDSNFRAYQQLNILGYSAIIFSLISIAITLAVKLKTTSIMEQFANFTSKFSKAQIQIILGIVIITFGSAQIIFWILNQTHLIKDFRCSNLTQFRNQWLFGQSFRHARIQGYTTDVSRTYDRTHVNEDHIDSLKMNVHENTIANIDGVEQNFQDQFNKIETNNSQGQPSPNVSIGYVRDMEKNLNCSNFCQNYLDQKSYAEKTKQLMFQENETLYQDFKSSLQNIASGPAMHQTFLGNQVPYILPTEEQNRPPDCFEKIHDNQSRYVIIMSVMVFLIGLCIITIGLTQSSLKKQKEQQKYQMKENYDDIQFLIENKF